MGWQRDVRTEWQELKGVITGSANYPTMGQREKYGSNNRSPSKMQLWRTWNSQQISLCPNSEIFQQCNWYRKRTMVMPLPIWSLISVMNCKIWDKNRTETGLENENTIMTNMPFVWQIQCNVLPISQHYNNFTDQRQFTSHRERNFGGGKSGMMSSMVLLIYLLYQVWENNPWRCHSAVIRVNVAWARWLKMF